MEVQKAIWIVLLLLMMAKYLVGYLQDHGKWTECPYSLDLWQYILFSLLTLNLILNIVSVIFYRNQVLNNFRIALLISLPIQQLTSIILMIIWSVLLIITISKHSECVIFN